MLARILSLGMPMGAEWLCILVFLGGVAAVVVVAVRSQQRPRQPPSAFPVVPLAPPGPGRFRVSGVRRDTRQDVVWECEADSPENAGVKAELEGIVVTRVDRA